MKQCPFCGEEIQDDAVKCRYCREWLTPAEGQPAQAPAGSGGDAAPGEVHPDVEAEIRRLLHAGRKIVAIKCLRDTLPELGLAEAKSIVDAMEAGKSLAQALAEQQYARIPHPRTSSGCALATLALLVALAAIVTRL